MTNRKCNLYINERFENIVSSGMTLMIDKNLEVFDQLISRSLSRFIRRNARKSKIKKIFNLND